MRAAATIASIAFALLIAPKATASSAPDPASMPAGSYVLDKAHAFLFARVQHLGVSGYTVRFTGFDASYEWDPAKPGDARVTATILANSVDTADKSFDGKVAAKFLDSEANPTIRFVSTKIAYTGEGKGVMTGDLTFHGVTRPVSLDVTFNGYTSGVTKARAGFSARGRIKRSDFGSTYLLNPPQAYIGDDVDLIFELEFEKT